MGVGPSRQDDFLYDKCECHGTPLKDLEGFHRLVNREGATLEADFAKGVLEQGLWVSPTNDKYRGPFKDGRFHGHGKFQWADGRVFEGSFHKDCPVRGTMQHGDTEPFDVLYDGVTPFFRLGSGKKLSPRGRAAGSSQKAESPPPMGSRTAKQSSIPTKVDADQKSPSTEVERETENSGHLMPKLGEDSSYVSLHLDTETHIEMHLEGDNVSDTVRPADSVDGKTNLEAPPERSNFTDPIKHQWNSPPTTFPAKLTADDVKVSNRMPQEETSEQVEPENEAEARQSTTCSSGVEVGRVAELGEGTMSAGVQSESGMLVETGRMNDASVEDDAGSMSVSQESQNQPVQLTVKGIGQQAQEGCQVITEPEHNDQSSGFGSAGLPEREPENKKLEAGVKQPHMGLLGAQQSVEEHAGDSPRPPEPASETCSESELEGGRGPTTQERSVIPPAHRGSEGLGSEGPHGTGATTGLGESRGADLQAAEQGEGSAARCACHGRVLAELEGWHAVEEGDGRRFEGEWEAGVWHGHGSWANPLLGRYTGSWKGGVFHGRGVFRWPEEHDTSTSAGERRAHSWESFDGEFDQGCPEVGVLEMRGGSRFDVAFDGCTSIFDSSLQPVSSTPVKPALCTCHGLEASRLNGTHTVLEQDGRVYAGEWVQGLWQGQGQWKNPALGEYEGSWSGGLFHGLGTLTWADGRMLHGNFEHGCPVSGILLGTDGESKQVWFDGKSQAFAELTPIRTKDVPVEDPESWTQV